MSNYLKLPEVAHRLGVSEKTARRYIKSGALPSVFIGNAYRVEPNALTDFVEHSRGSHQNGEEVSTAPKAQTPLPLDSGEERGRYPYPWMSDSLETLINTWERQVEERHNPAQSRTIMVAALDVQDAVTFNYRDKWETLSEREKKERRDLASRLETLAMQGIAHYKDSKQAEAAELEAVERRREEIKAATKRISA